MSSQPTRNAAKPEALLNCDGPSILKRVDALISTIGAVMSKVVPALISKCPSAEAKIFSPPAAS